MDITIVKPSFEILTPVAQIQDYMNQLEIAGRTCYKSERLMTEDSSNKFVHMIIKSGHNSVLEHCNITVRIIGDRSMSHQLVRHRIAAYSQESQRYCNYGKKGLQVILPLSIAKTQPEFGVKGHDVDLVLGWNSFIEKAYSFYLHLLANGIPPEDARSVLPNATKTEVVTTFNLRQWRHVFVDRALNKKAQWQIREIMLSGLQQFKELLPVVFEDLIIE